MIGQTLSHYRIIKELGQGGMGVVYLAEDMLLGRQVAIKMLKEASRPGKEHYHIRFRREAQHASKLSHPHIATIHDFGETPDGRPYIVMEYVKGKTLSDLIQEHPLSLPLAVKIVTDVAEALSEAHRNGIVHRDIKPSNVAINERGVVKVLDFGLAKHLNSLPEETNAPEIQPMLDTQTREGVVVCTPEYSSPEQALGVAVDARSDLFSLGSVLYECVTGKRAFSGANDADTRAQVIQKEPPPPSTHNAAITKELDRISLKALAKKPEERYQSAAELINDLRASEATLENYITPTNGNAVIQKPIQTSSLQDPETRGGSRISAILTRAGSSVVVIMVLVAVLLTLGIWYAWQPRPYVPTPAAKRWYDQGTTALEDGTYYKASKMFEEATKQDQNFALAHALLAEASSELGYFDKATAEISKANLLVAQSALPKTEMLYLQAIHATVTRDFKAAIDIYRNLVTRAADSDKPHFYVSLGRAYEKNGELKNAIDSYQKAIVSNSQYASAFLREGVLYAREQDLANAEAAFDNAFHLYEIQSNPEGRAEVLYQRGVLYNSKGDTRKARENLERAFDAIREFSSPSQQIKTRLQLSSLYRLMQDTELAKRYTNEAIDLARANGLSDLTVLSLIEMGNVFFFREEIDEAEKYFKQALELAQTENVRVNLARALFSLGSLYVQQDNPDEGIPYLTQALPFFEQNGYRMDVMQSQTLLGQAYDLKGNYTEALKAFGVQLELATQLNNPLQIARSHKGLGTVLAHQEKFTEALNHIEQSYSLYSAAGNKLYAGYSLISRADVLWRLGRYEEAKASLSQASSLAEQPDGKFKQLWGRLYVVTAPMALSEQLYAKAITDGRKAIANDVSKTKHPAIESLYAVGLAQSLSGLKSQGLKTCEDATEMASRSGDPRLLAGAQLALAEVLLNSGNPTRALVMAKSAQPILERSGQLESEWRAWLIAGRASQLLGDHKAARESFLRADSQFSSLQQRWGSEYFATYANRPDIKRYQEQLRRTSVAAR